MSAELSIYENSGCLKSKGIKMHPLQKQYVTNESGTKIAVQLDIRAFQQLEGYIELLEDRIDLELAIKGSQDLTDWDDFVKELRKEGKL